MKWTKLATKWDNTLTCCNNLKIVKTYKYECLFKFMKTVSFQQSTTFSMEYSGKIIWISISFLVICLTISLFLWMLIYRYINEKPLVSVTLVDWIYRDTIVYIYCFCFAYSIAIIHTILAGNDKFSLRFQFTIVYTILINFFCNNIYVCLTIAAVLRLISLIKSSEAAGLQLLGPDNEAISVIRCISVLSSSLFPCFVINVLNAYPGLFGLFHGEVSRSNLEDIQKNKYVSFYLLLPCVTFVINVSTMIYSSWIKKQMKDAVSVFIIYIDDMEKVYPKKFSFSIPQATVVPALTITVFVQSFCDRKQRLLFLSPLHVFLCSVVLPAFIIFNNKKIRKYFKVRYLANAKSVILRAVVFFLTNLKDFFWGF